MSLQLALLLLLVFLGSPLVGGSALLGQLARVAGLGLSIFAGLVPGSLPGSPFPLAWPGIGLPLLPGIG